MSFNESKLATAKTVLSTVASIAAAAMVARTIARDYLPAEVQDYLFSGLRNLVNRFSNHLTMVIHEFDGLVSNQIYEAVEVYLGPKTSPTTRRLKISIPDKEQSINIAMERDEEVTDAFEGVKFKWVWVCQQVESREFHNPRDMNSTLRSEVRSFELTFPKKHKQKALQSYIPYILKEAKSITHEKKSLKIFTIDPSRRYRSWMGVNLDHPANFETLAMDCEVKSMLLKDLKRFVRRREYYRKVGKAWKRGYLLYGPPGTGKSSLIAAMANYLKFDVYDLELTMINGNYGLRRLLLATANRSILVVEDIDCTIELQDRAGAALASGRRGGGLQDKKVTLSGLLNFVDGLWSSCGDERIIVFTTNHKDKLDPALLRPGRMDVHIHMSYCTPGGFKLLASNYLGMKAHDLYGEIEDLIGSTKVTPAEVADQLLKGDEPYDALRGLIEFVSEKRKENEETKAKKVIELKNIEKEEESEKQEEIGGEENEYQE
ncbi:Protein HYPER-SENSITIVITY-RELATED like [Actinidia chinensis var. chinensis]|uniref:Protein HYPER-SENSITIVITY-RELATED like n=1 Tax=Actinidia chinensis var. chinensis TaxID=1590841 RepID=A0A2R6QD82_ACTCC|nr:Protein HYPER-SENSITIVITY-RELATED like [Actinidia chinensis var. chinensis]